MIKQYKDIFFTLQNKKLNYKLTDKELEMLLKIEDWYIYEQEQILYKMKNR
jgi:hypothetical protein